MYLFCELGFAGGGGGSRRANKSKPIVHKLGVSLEELYNGKTRKLAVTREVCCEKVEIACIHFYTFNKVMSYTCTVC